MPTLTFYADEETAQMLEELIAEKSRLNGFEFSRGKLFSPFIKDEHERICHPRKIPTQPQPKPVEKKRRAHKAKPAQAAALSPAL